MRPGRGEEQNPSRVRRGPRDGRSCSGPRRPSGLKGTEQESSHPLGIEKRSHGGLNVARLRCHIYVNWRHRYIFFLKELGFGEKKIFISPQTRTIFGLRRTAVDLPGPFSIQPLTTETGAAGREPPPTGARIALHPILPTLVAVDQGGRTPQLDIGPPRSSVRLHRPDSPEG